MRSGELFALRWSDIELKGIDAETGKELWTSGEEITSFAHNGELSVANGRVYLGTFDGMLYCYGVAK